MDCSECLEPNRDIEKMTKVKSPEMYEEIAEKVYTTDLELNDLYPVCTRMYIQVIINKKYKEA